MTDFDRENEKKLVSLLRDGEAEAFDQLYPKYGTKLYRFSFSLLKNDEDTSEIVQETFFRI